MILFMTIFGVCYVGQERLERRYNDQMNDFLESNLQAKKQPVKKDYYSAEAEAFVRTPSVYVQLHVRKYQLIQSASNFLKYVILYFDDLFMILTA